jgi:hypothetical protein
MKTHARARGFFAMLDPLGRPDTELEFMRRFMSATEFLLQFLLMRPFLPHDWFSVTLLLCVQCTVHASCRLSYGELLQRRLLIWICSLRNLSQ